MPLIKPEVQNVLRAVGLEKPENQGTASEKLSLAGLSPDRIAEELTELATSSGNESLRLRAIETALKVHGALKEQPTSSAIPSITIILQSSSPSTSQQTENQILFPRQSLGPSVQSPSSKKVD